MHPFPHSPTRIIFTSGSDYEIGCAHYEQIGSDCHQGMIQFYNRFFRQMSGQSQSNPLDKLKSQVQKLIVQKGLAGKLKKNLPRSTVERLQGLSDAGELDIDLLIFTTILPDLMPTLTALMTRTSPNRFTHVAMPRVFGCTSFLTNTDKFLIGRNLDFPGVGYWDRYPVIQLIKKPHKIPTIAITTAGNPLGGITGINSEKIYVALHQHYGRSVNFSGQLPFVIGERILENASTLDEAKKILTNSNIATAWAFVVADGKSRKGFVCEKQPYRIGFRDLEPEHPLTHSNYYQTPECQKDEIATSERMNWDNFHRQNRPKQLLSQMNNSPSLDQAVKIISDHFDPYFDAEAIAGRTVSVAHNIQSLVLDIDQMDLYMAEGNAPIHIRQYKKYDLASIFNENHADNEESLEGFRFKDQAMHSARENYGLSFICNGHEEYEKASRLLDTCLEVQANGVLAVTSAMLNLKLTRNKKAIEILEKSRHEIEEKCKSQGKKDMPPEYYETLFWLARSHELNNEISKSAEYYGVLKGNSDVKDRHIRFSSSSGRPFTRESLDKLYVPYSIFSPIE